MKKILLFLFCLIPTYLFGENLKVLNGNFEFLKPISYYVIDKSFSAESVQTAKENVFVRIKQQDFNSAGRIIDIALLLGDEVVFTRRFDSENLVLCRKKYNGTNYSYVAFDSNFRYFYLVYIEGKYCLVLNTEEK